MELPDAARMAAVRDVGRVMLAFSRTARARPLYNANNQTLVGMLDELMLQFTEVLTRLGEISIRTRPDAFIYEGERVFEDPDHDRSIPFVFYRDGIRRLEFVPGMTMEELDTLLTAAGRGFNVRGMEDDVVSFLWSHDLVHIHYVTVDTTVISSMRVELEETDAEEANARLDADIDLLLRAIYMPTDRIDDGAFRSFNVDATDIPAKAIADAMDDVDEMAPGFHPARQLETTPVYGRSLVTEVSSDSDRSMLLRAFDASLAALETNLSPDDEARISKAVLGMFDASVLSEDLESVTVILRHGAQAWPGERFAAWLRDALSEARVRQICSICQAQPDRTGEVVAILKLGGARVGETLLKVLPSFHEPEQRRRFADLALELGLPDPAPLYEMLSNEQGFVAQEALYLLHRRGSLTDPEVLRAVHIHPKAQVRLVLVGLAGELPEHSAITVGIELIRDQESAVRVKAADLLGQHPSERTRRALDTAVRRPELLEAPIREKRALVNAFSRVHGDGAVSFLQTLIKDANRFRSTKDQTELAIAAELGLALIRTPAALEGLKQACVMRLNKQVRQTARDILSEIKEGRR